MKAFVQVTISLVLTFSVKLYQLIFLSFAVVVLIHDTVCFIR